MENRDEVKEEIDMKDELNEREKSLNLKENELQHEAERIKKADEDLQIKYDEYYRNISSLKMRNQELEAERKELDIDRDLLAHSQEEYKKKKEEIEAKEKDIALREQNAKEGFSLQKSEAETEKTDRINKLTDQIKVLEEELCRLEGEKNDHLRKMYEDLDKARQERIEIIDDEVRQRMSAVERAEDQLKDAQNKFLEKQDECARKKEEAQLAQEKAIEEKRKYSVRLQGMNEEIEKQAGERAKELVNFAEQEKNRQKGLVERVSAELKKEQEQNEEYQAVERRTGGKSKEQLAQEIETLKSEKKDLKSQLLSMPSDYEELKEKADKADAWRQECERLKSHNNELYSQAIRYEYYGTEMQRLKDQIDRKDFEISELNSILAECKTRLREIQIKYENTPELEKRIRDIKENLAFTQNEFPSGEIGTEIEWLKDIFDKCEKSEIFFKKRLLFAFHTALKSGEMSPLTVLAGVSGTGKSELPRLYARFGGIYFLSLPVQPDWDSPQSLFGYFNTVESRYNSTELLTALVQFSDKDDDTIPVNLGDKMLLVLLDEMNLAHVELYFSDMLSKLESRRGSDVGETISVDLGASFKYDVKIGKNILWTGTMNEDETTKMLSDKVIDRGFEIYFPRPETLYSRNDVNRAECGNELDYGTWEKWSEKDSVTFSEEDIGEFRKALEDINLELAETGRAIGHRVWQAVERYMSCHPMVKYWRDRKDENAEYAAEKYKKALTLSFEEAVVYKVMPKFRGIELESDITSGCLNEVKEILDKTAPGIMEDYNLALINPDGQFIWRSAKYLDNEDEFYQEI